MSVAYEAAKAAHFGPHPLGQSILGTVESIAGLKVEQMRDYFARRYSPANIVLAFAGKTDWDQVVALAETHCGRWTGGEATAPGRRPARHRRVPGAPPRRRPAADDHRRRRRPAARERRPLRRPAPGDRPGRPHRLAALLGPDRPRPRRRRRALVPGLQPGRRLLHLPELRARTRPRPTSAGSPRSTARCMAEGLTDDELTQAKNKVLARSVLRSERPMGRLASLGFHWTYRHEYLSVADELEAFSRVTARRPPPGARPLAAPADDDRLGRADDRRASAEIAGGRTFWPDIGC